MREIKFRAWDSFGEGQMYYTPDYLAIRLDGIPIGCEEFENDKGKFSDENFDSGIPRYKSNFYRRITLMQFTGLLDKNGKEIYEGDIIQWSDGSKSDVVWEDAMFKVWDDTYNPPKHKRIALYDTEAGIEIIGNIYENSELLK